MPIQTFSNGQASYVQNGQMLPANFSASYQNLPNNSQTLIPQYVNSSFPAQPQQQQIQTPIYIIPNGQQFPDQQQANFFQPQPQPLANNNNWDNILFPQFIYTNNFN